MEGNQQPAPAPYQGQPQPQSQPTPQPVPQPVLVPIPADFHQPEGQWRASLFDCCSPFEDCLLGTFIPCLLLGKTSERLRDPSMQTFEPLNSDCMLHFAISCLTGCGWIYAMIKRSDIRDQFNIEGDGCSDCCVSYWCSCCALIQQEKEVKMRTAGMLPVIQQYQATKGMTMELQAQSQMQPQMQYQVQQQPLPQAHPQMQIQPMVIPIPQYYQQTQQGNMVILVPQQTQSPPLPFQQQVEAPTPAHTPAR